jgi:hypothetical protein
MKILRRISPNETTECAVIRLRNKRLISLTLYNVGGEPEDIRVGVLLMERVGPRDYTVIEDMERQRKLLVGDRDIQFPCMVTKEQAARMIISIELMLPERQGWEWGPTYAVICTSYYLRLLLRVFVLYPLLTLFGRSKPKSLDF